MTNSELETVFRWDAEDDVVAVWTAQPPVKRKLEKAGYEPYRVSTQAGEPVGWFFKIPLAEFRWRAGSRKSRVMSPEQRKAAGERLAAARVVR